ncbi:hypothetical protein EJ04DRAFT_527123 [Polyplosphaeria fusca]|uniref:Uncharacterized protein n=1 Tax=Polyplosphaeria fusca TaxID=682080 RepID=A0A9P4QSR6_9PLEO|nr:hypothetical protein EJ04DRAFT_527123 [Polyplosphaeria fusca]
MLGGLVFVVAVLALTGRGHHISLVDSNITSTNNFNTNDLWNNVATYCGPDLSALSACPPPNSNIKLRKPASINFAQCFEDVFKAYFTCSDLGDHGDSNPIKEEFVPLNEFEDQGNCGYPDLQKTLKEACTFDANEFGRTNCCKDEGVEDCSQQALNLLICELQAAEQYVRCTNSLTSSNSTSNTTSCITDNAEIATWLPKDFLVFSGTPTCPTAHKLLTTLAISNIIALASALLSNTQLWKNVLSRAKVALPPAIRLNFLSMFISIGVHISIPFIMGIILQKQGYTINWLQQVLLWTVRPRAAPLIAILGFFHASFMETAINEMVADLLFSIPAANFAVYAALFPNKTKNPMKPAVYKVFHAGGIIMLIPGVILTLALMIGFCNKCAPIRAFKYPLQDLMRILSNPVRKVMKKDEMERRSVDVTIFRSYFIQFFVLGIILYIGSWMVWSSFLQMAGDLYCPASLGKVAAVLWCYPVILNAVRAVVGLL